MKSAVALITGLALLFFAANIWLADLCSAGLSYAIKQNVIVDKATWRIPGQIHLKGVRVLSGRGETLLRSESMQIKIHGLVPFRALIFLNYTEISPLALVRFKSAAAFFNTPVSKAFEIQKLSLSVHQKSNKTIIQLFGGESSVVRLRGGASFQGKKLLKLNTLVLISNAKTLARIPKSLRERLVMRPDGWFGAKVSYAANRLRLYGSRGPLLEAQWGF